MREALLIIATGTKKVGKTYTTCKAIEKYIYPNQKTGKIPQKVLIFDINMEYTEETSRDNGVTFKANVLDIDDLPKWTKSSRVEVRRIIPKDKNGNLLGIDGKVELLNKILHYYRNGLLVLEDINQYLIGTNTAEVIGILATNRHRDLDIYIHLQSLAPVTTRMWQNCQVVRFHKQIDDINRIKSRIPNVEIYFIAEKLVNQKCIRDRRFFCYVQNEYNKITGKFNIRDFQKACYAYIHDHPKIITNAQKRFGKTMEARDKAIKFLLHDFLKYYGNPIKKQ